MAGYMLQCQKDVEWLRGSVTNLFVFCLSINSKQKWVLGAISVITAMLAAILSQVF